jgi:hypothetical protein
MLLSAAVVLALLVTGAFLFQRRLIYLPFGVPPSAASAIPGAEDVVLRTEDGLALGAWFVPSRSGPPRATVAVFNGNAGNRSFRAELAEALSERGFSVLLLDYRGYGGNPGRPTEEGLRRDARAALAWLLAHRDVDPGRIVYFGESLGSAVALGLARERPPFALVLRSPFTSLPDAARVHFPLLPVRLILLDRYPSLEGVREVRCPVLVIAGDRDSVIPLSQSLAIHRAAPAGAALRVVSGADHNDFALLAGEDLLAAVEGFLGERIAAERDAAAPQDPR